MLFLELKLRTASRCASKSVDFFQNKLPFFLNVFFFFNFICKRESVFKRQSFRKQRNDDRKYFCVHRLVKRARNSIPRWQIQNNGTDREAFLIPQNDRSTNFQRNLMTNDKHFRDVKLPTVSSSKLGIYFSDYWVYPEKIDARYV